MPRPPRAESRYAPSQRLEVLRAALAARAMTYDEIAELLEVSRSTVTRLLRALGAAHDLEESEDPEGRKRFRIAQGAATQSVRLTTTQLVALYASCGLASFFDGTGIKEDLDAVYERISVTLKKSDAAFARNLDRKVLVVPGGGRRDYTDRAGDVDDVMTALLHEQRLEILYPSSKGGEQILRLDPYTLVFYDHGLYIAGYSHTHAKVVTLALERCRAIKWLRGDCFTFPEDYRPASLVASSFGLHSGAPTAVRVRFTGPSVRIVRRATWHATQVIRDLPDGAIELAMRVANTPELRAWVLSHGAHAEVLAPAELRAEIAEALEGAARAYRRPARRASEHAAAPEAATP